MPRTSREMLSLNSGKVVRLLRLARCFKCPQSQKSHGFKSGDREGHRLQKGRLMTLSPFEVIAEDVLNTKGNVWRRCILHKNCACEALTCLQSGTILFFKALSGDRACYWTSSP
ncbi:hypothetical protein AVEN_210873-1 [Araneus ventricosus]|uniref:Uncharacterized protein n=1 Tax=Araneus ventricosus TaxID=182803 RepID=A0A4Y2J4Z7_ARAVE|nr:hypothetical protein AVEN_210873-1 [Araneus ventricosus]